LQNNIFSGLFVGQNLVTIKEVDSTNNLLKEMLSNSKPLIEGTVIMAENQYAGRGQHQNGWHTEPGKNLTFSILLNPDFLSLADQFDLIRIVSLGVFDAIAPLLGEKLKIKWPNDIYYGDHKLCGMLIENVVQGSQIKHSVIGIGINVNQETFPWWLPMAISLKQILHQDYDLNTLLAEVCNNIEVYYLNLKAGKKLMIRDTYLSRLYRLNEVHNFKAGDVTFSGRIKGVSDAGRLIVLTSKQKELVYTLKEIAFLDD
jgi:BirA family biotin operon repressor/biotin-[acetyl-CoA-carboxylase] ligase